MKKTKFTEVQIIGAVKQLEAGPSAKDLARELGGSSLPAGAPRRAAT